VAVPSRWDETGLAGHDGTAWYRTRFVLPPGRLRVDQILELGRVENADAAYLNGELVGSTGRFPPEYAASPDTARSYRLPAGLLRWSDADGRPLENVLAIRVYAKGGAGGIRPAGPVLPPAAWHRPLAMGGEPADLVLLVNWTDAPLRIALPLSRIGADPAVPRVAYDAVEETSAGETGDTIAADLRPHASRLIVLRAASGRPQVMATSRHLVPGAVDLEGAAWDDASRTLRGKARRLIPPSGRVPGTTEPAYAVVVHVPRPLRLARAEASVPCVAERIGDGLIRVNFPDVPGETLEWAVRFEGPRPP
jgi:hypothetical protein